MPAFLIRLLPRHRPIAVLAIALPLLLSGCAALQPEPAPQVSASQRHYHNDIQLGGRLSVRYEVPSGEEGVHGSFEWLQANDRTTLTLFSPLGQAIARIVATPHGATLTQAGKAPIAADDVDSLTTQTLGWPLPVSGLRDWLQGFAVDTDGQRFIATPDNNAATTPEGWHISYPAWTGEGSTGARPRRVDLVRQTEQAGKVALRIVIDTWQAP
ncbi:MAG TPA: lipoprotein insertase outer membrane protein LolB [Noviherbaspirillum sp.]